MHRKNLYNINNKTVIGLLFISLFCITIGYSLITRDLSIMGKVYIPSDNVRKIIANGLKSGELLTDASSTNDFGSKYYFTGSNPNNYVIFNNACWRIVNIANNNTVKIVYEAKTTSMNDCVGVAKNNSGSINSSIIFDDGNNNFYESNIKGVLDSYSNGNIDNIIMSESNIERIETATFYVGAVNKDDTLSNIVTQEKINKGASSLSDKTEYTYTNKIGLLNVSDLKKSADFLLKNYSFYLLNSDESNTSKNTCIANATLSTCPITNKYLLRPVLYLKSNTYYTGEGTEIEPYRVLTNGSGSEIADTSGTVNSKTYNITYNLNGGTNNSSNPSTYTVETNNITLKAPIKEGYTFTGWTIGKNLFDYDSIISSTALYGNIDKTLFKVKANTYYTLSTNLPHRSDNGCFIFIKGTDDINSSWSSSDNGVCINKPITVKSTSNGNILIGFYRPSDEFSQYETGLHNGIYWVQLEENDTETSYESYISTPTKSITIPTGSEGSRTYTANWTPTTYNINYDLAGGTNNASNPKTYTIESNDITLQNPTRDGYAFDGWTVGKNLLSNIEIVNTSLNVLYDFYGISYYLKVKPKTNYIFSLDGIKSSYQLYEYDSNKENVKYMQHDFDHSFITTDNTQYIRFRTSMLHSWEGFTNTNFQIEEGDTSTSYEPYISTPTKNIKISKGSAGNRTYVANWKKIYKTTFNGNGGTSFSVNVVDGETSTYYPISEQSGKVFLGWFTAVSGGTLLMPGTFDYYQDRTVYAHWGDPISYTAGNAWSSVQAAGYTTWTYDSTTAEYTVSQNIPSGAVWYNGMINFNYFGPIPFGSRYVVSFEIYPSADYKMGYDTNNNCSGCSGNDHYGNFFRLINGDFSSSQLQANTWNKVIISYLNGTNSTNPNNSEVYDWTGFRLETTSNITYKVRNVKYTYFTP